MGELRVNAANGKIAVDRPQSAVFAKTANGDIVLGAVACGEVVAETGWGRVEIGLPKRRTGLVGASHESRARSQRAPRCQRTRAE